MWGVWRVHHGRGCRIRPCCLLPGTAALLCCCRVPANCTLPRLPARLHGEGPMHPSPMQPASPRSICRVATILNNAALLGGSLLCTTAHGLAAMLAGRFLAGLGAGAASVLVPRYGGSNEWLQKICKGIAIGGLTPCQKFSQCSLGDSAHRHPRRAGHPHAGRGLAGRPGVAWEGVWGCRLSCVPAGIAAGSGTLTRAPAGAGGDSLLPCTLFAHAGVHQRRPAGCVHDWVPL